MADGKTPRLNKAPFWFADAMLLATAATLVAVGGRPLKSWEMVAIVACVALGGWLSALPELKEYEAAVKRGETDRLADTTEKLGQLEDLAGRITGATSQWQGVQERATQTAELARSVVDRLTREAETFAAAVSRTADTDKQNLKLEVEKLRRAEGEWLQAVGRVMDHIFALHVAGVRSGQGGLADQLERFHGACRDALRRVGFVTLVAAPDDPFDSKKHQTLDGSRPPEGSRVDETVAPGFVFQGQLLRPVVVRLVGDAAPGAGGRVAGTPAPDPGGGKSVSFSTAPGGQPGRADDAPAGEGNAA